MAHEISTVTVNGRSVVEAMYANSPAWHGLGQLFDQNGRGAPDSATAMELAHLDWKVDLEPMKLDNGLLVPGHKATVRQDLKGKPESVLGVVSDRYKVVQNAEAFEFLDSLLQDGIMRYESAMALKGGKRIALLARMPSVDKIAEGDWSMRYVLMSTSHDGSAALYLQPTSVRVVCANTLALALANKQHQVRIQHTGNVKAALETAKVYLSQFDKAFSLYSEEASVLATRRYSPADAKEYMHQLGLDDDSKAKQMTATRQAFMSKANNLPSVKGTWWALFNAVTEAVDHGAKYRGKTLRDKAESRFLATMEGTGSDFKSKAFTTAIEMSTAAAV